MKTITEEKPVIDQDMVDVFKDQKFEIKDDPTLPPPQDFGQITPAEEVIKTVVEEVVAGADKKADEVKTDINPDTHNPDGSLKKPVEKPADEIKNEVVQKTLDQLLEEKTEGKYKTFDELHNVINTNPFADEAVKVINDFVAAGGTVEDYYATQSTDFTSLSPIEVMEYKILAEDPDMTDDEVSYELKKRFGVDGWKDKPEEYEGGVEPEEIRINKLKFNREVSKHRQALIDQQKAFSIPEKKVVKPSGPDPKLQQKWGEEVKAAVDSLAKIPLKIVDDKGIESIHDFEIDPAEQAAASKIVNDMFLSAESPWEKYIDRKTGKIDLKGITKDVLVMRNYEKAIQFVAQQNKAKGAAEVVKEIKNVDFTPDGTKVVPKAKSLEEQVAEQFAKHGN